MPGSSDNRIFHSYSPAVSPQFTVGTSFAQDPRVNNSQAANCPVPIGYRSCGPQGLELPLRGSAESVLPGGCRPRSMKRGLELMSMAAQDWRRRRPKASMMELGSFTAY